jgi:hypothetical protein
MRTSEQIGELAAALAKAQGEMKSALKTAVNSAFARGGSGGSKYATLADCADAAHPVLAKNGLCLIGAMDTDHFVARLAHSSGQWIEGRWPVPGDLTKMTIQQMMACQTYLRRASYSLVGLVSDEDDDGNEAAKVGAIGVKKGIGIHSPIGDVQIDDNAIKYSDAMRDAVAAGDVEAAFLAHLDLHEEGEELYRAAWSLLDSKTRSAVKKIIEQRKAA